MPDETTPEFTPEEHELLADAPADAATFVGGGEVSADDEVGAATETQISDGEAPPVPQG
jgi:hypothetical protein